MTLVHVGDGHACTHGGDGSDARARRDRGAGSGLTEAPCPGNGRRGKRVRVFYGYPEGHRPPRLADHKPTIADALRTADLNLDAQSPGAEGQHYRFWCETDLRPTIRAIELVPVGGDAAYDGGRRDQVALRPGRPRARRGEPPRRPHRLRRLRRPPRRRVGPRGTGDPVLGRRPRAGLEREQRSAASGHGSRWSGSATPCPPRRTSSSTRSGTPSAPSRGRLRTPPAPATASSCTT